MHILIVGAGNMAREYIKILKNLNVSFEVIGRSEKSAKDLEVDMEVTVIDGGLDNSFEKLNNTPTHAIVASSYQSLESNTMTLLEKGIKKILLEKPGSASLNGLERINKATKAMNANVFIAYNRRFYASILEAKKRIEEDGGLSSFVFEFTEWGHIVTKLNKNNFELENWFIGNSTHVLDTAFFFGGRPRELTSFAQSELDWHPSGSIFTGAGITESNVLFSYHANWGAPGSWKLELLTHKNRYIFRPFEKLHVQKLGNIEIEEVKIDNNDDIDYKPGLLKQTIEFLYPQSVSNLLSIDNAIKNMEIYEKIKAIN